MASLTEFSLRAEYKKVEDLGDKLASIDKLIDWAAFRPIIGELYQNKGPQGGRPNKDEIMMLKMLVLQQWYGLSDPELERQVADRISFRRFLGFPDKIPDDSTIWVFRQRLVDSGKEEEIWAELQRQLEAKGLTIKQGVIQDASFITADPGHAKKDKTRGEGAKTRRSRDGTWTKKGKKSSFGYKLHSKTDMDYGLIREYKTTTASVHDSQVDLSNEGEVVYRDRGYSGAACNGYNATMKKGARGHPIGVQDKIRNKRISRKRAPGERPYAVIKRVFNAGHTLATTVARVNVKNMFSCFCFNLYQLDTLTKRGIA